MRKIDKQIDRGGIHKYNFEAINVATLLFQLLERISLCLVHINNVEMHIKSISFVKHNLFRSFCFFILYTSAQCMDLITSGFSKFEKNWSILLEISR